MFKVIGTLPKYIHYFKFVTEGAKWVPLNFYVYGSIITILYSKCNGINWFLNTSVIDFMIYYCHS